MTNVQSAAADVNLLLSQMTFDLEIAIKWNGDPPMSDTVVTLSCISETVLMKSVRRMKGNVLFNDTFNTFLIR